LKSVLKVKENEWLLNHLVPLWPDKVPSKPDLLPLFIKMDAERNGLMFRPIGPLAKEYCMLAEIDNVKIMFSKLRRLKAATIVSRDPTIHRLKSFLVKGTSRRPARAMASGSGGAASELYDVDETQLDA
jgi:hypothetical protein